MWRERKYGRGSRMVEWTLDVPLRRGEYRPRVVFIPASAPHPGDSLPSPLAANPVTAITRFGYTRDFATIEEAKAWVEQREAFFSRAAR